MSRLVGLSLTESGRVMGGKMVRWRDFRPSPVDTVKFLLKVWVFIWKSHLLCSFGKMWLGKDAFTCYLVTKPKDSWLNHILHTYTSLYNKDWLVCFSCSGNDFVLIPTYVCVLPSIVCSLSWMYISFFQSFHLNQVNLFVCYNRCKVRGREKANLSALQSVGWVVFIMVRIWFCEVFSGRCSRREWDELNLLVACAESTK